MLQICSRANDSQGIKLTFIQISARVLSSSNSWRQFADGIASHYMASYHRHATLFPSKIKVKPMHTRYKVLKHSHDTQESTEEKQTANFLLVNQTHK
jgi:hypothetical protein